MQKGECLEYFDFAVFFSTINQYGGNLEGCQNS